MYNTIGFQEDYRCSLIFAEKNHDDWQEKETRRKQKENSKILLLSKPQNVIAIVVQIVCAILPLLFILQQKSHWTFLAKHFNHKSEYMNFYGSWMFIKFLAQVVKNFAYILLWTYYLTVLDTNTHVTDYNICTASTFWVH